MRQHITVNVEYDEDRLEVSGEYSPRYLGSRTQPAEPPTFEILHIKSLTGGNVALIAGDMEALQEVEQLCIQRHEEELAWSEMDEADERYERMKEAALWL